MELIKNAMNPEFWKRVREEDAYKPYREELLSEWDKECTKDIEAHRYSDFKLFFTTGDRSVYQATYYIRRRMLDNSALLALIYPEEEKYLVKLMDVIYAICDEYTWCIPAHQPSLDVNNNIHLDLFACETGFALSEIYTILGERLEPLIRDRIRVEIDRRIITALTNGTSYWWQRGRNNWNAVCTGSVGCTVMLMHPEMMPRMKPKFDASLEIYLDSFKEDGMCEEGFGYWHYGFGFFTVYADMIRTFTNGETNYFERPKVKKIACFIQKMYLSGGSTVSFSDGSSVGRYHLGMVHYLKDEYPDAVVIPDPQYTYNQDACGRWCLHLRSATWLNSKYLVPEKQSETATYFEPETQWFIRKTPKYGFAAKGGNNGESHNHNDIGSFIIAKNGRQMLIDPGSGPYTRQYFRKETRYGMVHCSSRGHSVPIIGDTYQQEGAAYKASGFSYEDGVFSVDIAGAYPIPELHSAKRSFEFADDTVTLTDKFDYEGEGGIVERFVSLVKPELVGDGSIVIDGLTLTFDAEKATPDFSEEPLNSTKAAYFTDLRLKSGVTEITVTVNC